MRKSGVLRNTRNFNFRIRGKNYITVCKIIAGWFGLRARGILRRRLIKGCFLSANFNRAPYFKRVWANATRAEGNFAFLKIINEMVVLYAGKITRTVKINGLFNILKNFFYLYIGLYYISVA